MFTVTAARNRVRQYTGRPAVYSPSHVAGAVGGRHGARRIAAYNSPLERSRRRYGAFDPDNRYSSMYLWEPK
jgi:hypothetical protein